MSENIMPGRFFTCVLDPDTQKFGPWSQRFDQDIVGKNEHEVVMAVALFESLNDERHENSVTVRAKRQGERHTIPVREYEIEVIVETTAKIHRIVYR